MDEILITVAPSLLKKQWSHQSAQINDRHKIGLDHCREILEGLVLDRPVVAYPCVVDEYVEPSESICDGLCKRFTMAGKAMSPARTIDPDLIGKLLEPAPPPGSYHYLSTSPAKGLGKSLPETGRGPGDESYPPRESRHQLIIASGSSSPRE